MTRTGTSVVRSARGLITEVLVVDQSWSQRTWSQSTWSQRTWSQTDVIPDGRGPIARGPSGHGPTGRGRPSTCRASRCQQSRQHRAGRNAFSRQQMRAGHVGRCGAESARRTLIRPAPWAAALTPASGRAAPTSNALVSSGLSCGRCCKRSAAAPAATAAASELPGKADRRRPFDVGRSSAGRSVLPGTRTETILRPGATRSGLVEAIRRGADARPGRDACRRLATTVPLSSEAPTVSTSGSMPGVWMVPAPGPSLPAAVTTTRPALPG